MIFLAFSAEEFLLKPVYATVIARIAEETRNQLVTRS
jgi:hypothetical protein